MRRHWVPALVAMMVGGFGTFGAVIALNELAERPDPRVARGGDGLRVHRPEPPKRAPTVRKQKPQKKRPTPPPPSVAALTSALGGVDVGLPAFDFSDLHAGDAGLLGETARDVAMTSETVDQPPQPVERGELDYPPDLRRAGVQGFVVLSILVSPEGRVEKVKVVESAPPGVFDEHAEDAVRAWRFSPGRYKGEPVKTWVRQKVAFELS